MIRPDVKGTAETQFFVEVDLSEADPMGLKIGGFYERHPVGRDLRGERPDDAEGWPQPLTARQAAWTVEQWTHGRHIVGAVPNFDAEVLDRLLRSQGILPAWHYHLIDVEALAVGYLAREYRYEYGHDNPPAIPLPWKSDALSKEIEVALPNRKERHTAMGDAQWAYRILEKVFG
jgi:hypothetical protein